MPKRMWDDPADELAKGPHSEPDNDEGMIDDVMGQDFESPEGEPENPLEDALFSAGFKPTPDQLMQIEAILKQPAKKPAPAPAPGGGLPPAKPPMGGGVAPAGMKPGDLMSM